MFWLVCRSSMVQVSCYLLNCTAVAMANIVAGEVKNEAAEGNLKEAITDFGGENDSDTTLVNMFVCLQYLGEKGAEMDE